MKQSVRFLQASRALPILVLAVILSLCSTGCFADTASREILMKAMRDEMTRNLGRLALDGMEKPFFISYNIFDVRTHEIVATLGSVVKSSEQRTRNHAVRLMVGDYSLNDENFQGSGSYRSSMIRGSSSLPIENDYQGIRRALWIATDDIYKRAAEQFEHKKAAMRQQMGDAETRVDDFGRAPVTVYTGDVIDFTADIAQWEHTAASVSKVFRSYPGIYSSQVRVYILTGDAIFTSTEGTEVILPLALASVQVNAYTQAVDGEPINNHISWLMPFPRDLPSVNEMTAAVEKMADELAVLRNAPIFDDSYFGPVLFEGDAVAEFFSQRLFGGRNGLMAERQPIAENRSYGYREEGETFEDRIGRRILSRDISVAALPGMEEFDGVRLIGRFAVDMEGVKPPSELVLVDNGILMTLLSNRTPTFRIRESNGHQRPVTGNGSWVSTALGPGVISISSSEARDTGALKNELLTRARDEGYDYGIVIRRLKPLMTGAQYYDPMARMTSSYGGGDGSLSEPLIVCKVYVADGREETVRSISLGAVGLSALRHIAGMSEKRIAVNVLSTANWNPGIPASFIVPEAMLLEELDVRKEKRDFTPLPPIVPSPIAAN